MDAGEVDMVTTVHNRYEVVLRKRKRPRENVKNRQQLRNVWGNSWAVNIEIPQVIDDYNHYMGGCDKAYQLISNYKPKLRCRRTWFPMFLHSLDICRVNSYIIAKQKDQSINQKDFILDWITALNERAFADGRATTRRAIAALASPPSSSKPKRIRMKKNDPELPNYRFKGSKQDHVPVLTTNQQGCTYCKYLKALAKANGQTPLPTVARPARKCLACGDHLCSLHFDQFHSR